MLAFRYGLAAVCLLWTVSAVPAPFPDPAPVPATTAESSVTAEPIEVKIPDLVMCSNATISWTGGSKQMAINFYPTDDPSALRKMIGWTTYKEVTWRVDYLTGQQLTFLFIQGTGYTEAYNATVLQSTNATCVKPENYNIITVDSTSTAGFVGNIDTSAHKNGGVIGGAVGGILGALALVAIFLIWRHRKNRKRTFTGDVTGDNASEDAVLTPTESIKLEVPGSQRPNRYSASPRPKPQ